MKQDLLLETPLKIQTESRLTEQPLHKRLKTDKKNQILEDDVWYSPWDLDLELGGVLYEDAVKEQREREREEQEELLLGNPEEAEAGS